MATFDDLMKDEVVAKHPLLKGYHRLEETRRHFEAQASYGTSETVDSGELTDLFSMKRAPEKEAAPTNLRGAIFAASRALNDVLSQFILPIFPKISYNTVRDVKYARDSQTDVVEGLVVFNVHLISKSGVRKQATIPVKVKNGEATPPSIMEIEGRIYTVSQDSMDMVLDRVTAYEVPELRTMYEAPLTSEERDLALGLRNTMGAQPRDNTQNYSHKVREAAISTPPGWSEVVEELKAAEVDDLDTFPRPWIYILRNYILNHVSTASRDAWEPHLINKGFVLNPYGMNRGRNASKEGQVLEMLDDAPMEKEMEMEVSAPPMDMEEVIEEVIQKMYPGTRTPIESGDGVKFGPKCDMRGNIVEVNPDDDYLIVKSKGMEYRVKVEEIEAMPSTFKKMYM